MALDLDALASTRLERASAKSHDWFIEPREYERQEQRRGRRFAFNHVIPKQTALVIIDMIPFFVAESGYCRGIVPNIERLAEDMRAGGGLVSWIVPGSTQPHPALAEEFYGKDIAELFRTSGGSGSIADRIWSGLRPIPGDLLLEKFAYSAFFPGACGLPSILCERGIDTIVITGTLTNICCESSARDAFASGFRVIFVADATAARRDQDHNASLHNIYRSFGDVRSTDEVVDLIRRREQGAGLQDA
jgi:nicotinamidase-related amidase